MVAIGQSILSMELEANWSDGFYCRQFGKQKILCKPPSTFTSPLILHVWVGVKLLRKELEKNYKGDDYPVVPGSKI